MDYIQRHYAKTLKDYKESLNRKSRNIKQEIITHCENELLKGFVTVTQHADESLVMDFADLKLNIKSQDKFAFNDNKEVGLQSAFYYEDEFVFAMTITQTGNVRFSSPLQEEFPILDYDDNKIPLLLIHGILSVAHKKGWILLIA